jgi:nucleoside-diphosphate-sugar epimerase
MPVVGNPEKTEFNVVPRDFVVDAIAHLSARPQASGLVYNLADPKPLTVDKLLEELARSTGRKLLRLPMPLSFGKFLITKVPGVDRLFRIPASALDYFDHPTRYGTDQAQRDLASGNISCPRFTSYAPQLVHYMLEHPEVSAKAMA